MVNTVNAKRKKERVWYIFYKHYLSAGISGVDYNAVFLLEDLIEA